jgi:hypothetical protein
MTGHASPPAPVKEVPVRVCGRSVVVLLGAAVFGCSGDRRVGVEGTVTYAGEPIAVGSITFLPTGEKGIKAGGLITDGRYKLEPQFGLNPGPHSVEIRWNKPTGKKYRNEFGEQFDQRAEGLPAKYHTNSTLTADIQAGHNVIDFHLAK